MRRLLPALCALSLAPMLVSCGGAPRGRPSAESLSCPGCDVILVSIDTLRADGLGAYGNPRDTSPNIDRLAERGVLFANAYSQFPVTFPNHMSIFTGEYPWVHRVRVTRRDSLGPDVVTLPMVMKANGYRTVWAGIAHDQSLDLNAGFGRGFDDIVDPIDPISNWTRRALHWLTNHSRERFFMFLHTYRTHDPYLPHDASLERFAALDPTKMNLPTQKRSLMKLKAEVASAPDKFLSATFLAAHPELSPSLPLADRIDALGRLISDRDPGVDGIGREADARWKKAYWDRFDVRNPNDVAYLRALYDASVYEADQGIGRLYDRLTALGVADKTLIVITSDHGEEFLEHGNTMHHEDYIELSHVPLIFVFPGKRVARRPLEVVRSIDIMPTILDIVGLPAPATVQGVSLRPLMEGRWDASVPGVSFSQFFNSYAVRDERYTYVYNLSDKCDPIYNPARVCPQQEFYDRAADPGELHDVFAENPDLAARYRDALVGRLKADHDDVDNPWMKSVPQSGKQQLFKIGYW